MIETGKILQNRYLVKKQIGQGGMGAVYVATDKRFGSVVAIKETLVLEDAYRKAIEREARLLNGLKHVALPRVSDYFGGADGQFIVMEYIAGEDLSEMLDREKKAFPVADVLNWADQLLDALDYLHTQEMPVIHRDIKPQNLKLTPRNQIILLDFGLAKGNPTDVSHQTAAKSIFGFSRSYASLEQIQGTGTDPRSDLYSLAATLYHLLTGFAPEDALTRAMHVLSDKADTLKYADELNPLIPPGAAAILHNAMALNANQRPESARAMRRMLAEHELYAENRRAPIAAATALGAAPADHRTQILPPDVQTDVETRIMPADDGKKSARTTLINSDGAARPTSFYAAKPAGAKLKIAAALGFFLLIGTGFGLSYFSDFGAANENSGAAAPAAETNFTPASAESPTVSTDIPIVGGTAASNVVAIAAPPNKPAVPAADNPLTATKKNIKSATAQPKTPGDSMPLRIEGETVYIGNMKITDDQIETPDAVINENGVRLKKGASRRKFAASADANQPSREELQYLTPAQRQQLLQLRNIRIKTPTGTPLPPDAPNN